MDRLLDDAERRGALLLQRNKELKRSLQTKDKVRPVRAATAGRMNACSSQPLTRPARAGCPRHLGCRPSPFERGRPPRPPQDLAACQIRATRLSELLRAAEAAKRSAEEYSRKLEAKFEKSGRGVALLKAAKLQMELRAVQEESVAVQQLCSAKVGGCGVLGREGACLHAAHPQPARGWALGGAAERWAQRGMGDDPGQAPANASPADAPRPGSR